jgi:hypothetical protein
MTLWSKSEILLCILLPTSMRSKKLPNLREYPIREVGLVNLFLRGVGWREDRELAKIAARGNQATTFVDSQTPGAQANVLMEKTV